MEIILNTNVLTDEDKPHMEVLLRNLIIDLSASLKITSLKKVIIPFNFTDEIIAFQKTHHKTETGHRNTDEGTAFGKVITYNELTDFSQAIFLHEGLLAGLLNEETSQEVIHYIHHELGHVHDNFYLKDIYTPSLLEGDGVSRLQALLQEHSNIMWTEYFANRSSYTTAKADIMLNPLQNVINTIVSLEDKSKEYIDRYKTTRDTSELINNFLQLTDLLFYHTAQALGYLHPLKNLTDDTELDNKLLSFISNTFYADIWNQIDKALSDLYDKYPIWNDVYELEKLNEAVSNCWENLGVSVYMRGSEVYIDVQ